MVEKEALLSIRESIIENLSVPRPESLQDELVDEVRAIDWQLGATALFVLDRSEYQPPRVYEHESRETPVYEEVTLF